MHKKHLPTLLVAFLPLLAGCGGFGCDSIGVFALRVDIRDSRTDEPAARGATLIARREFGADTVHVSTAGSPGDSAHLGSLYVGMEAGRYDLTITRPGYQTWRRDGVRVGSDGIFCPRPRTRHVLAELDPLDEG